MLDFKNKIIGKIKEKFEVRENRRRDHIYYLILHKGKLILRTKCSHGSSGQEIDDNILSHIKRQLSLDTKVQLNDLKNCPMSAEDYFNLLKQKNVISD